MSLKEDFGKVPLYRADRGIYIYGFCLPLCARCTGLLAGSIAGTAALHLLKSKSDKNGNPVAALLIGSAMLVPTAVDGAVEYYAVEESNNRRRLITGLIAGIGCAFVEKSIVDIARG